MNDNKNNHNINNNHDNNNNYSNNIKWITFVFIDYFNSYKLIIRLSQNFDINDKKTLVFVLADTVAIDDVSRPDMCACSMLSRR